MNGTTAKTETSKQRGWLIFLGMPAGLFLYFLLKGGSLEYGTAFLNDLLERQPEMLVFSGTLWAATCPLLQNKKHIKILIPVLLGMLVLYFYVRMGT